MRPQIAILCTSFFLGAASAHAETHLAWPGESFPLPMTVKTPADLAIKGAAERQYLIFNLIVAGKQAWDAGDFATAASKWEDLLRLPGLDAQIERILRPVAAEARSRAGGSVAAPPAPGPGAAPQAAPVVEAPARVTVSGKVVGGGSRGPGGAVVWLKRTDGKTPAPTAGRNKVVSQINKTFVPHVLPVTVGTKVEFKNQDDIFHNVFSLSQPNNFDAGLYKSGTAYAKTFTRPGAVQMLCNIHASMIGYVVVIDTPYYGQAEGGGVFTIRGVVPGEYELVAWHEAVSATPAMKLTVGREGNRRVTVRLGGAGRPPAQVPDKYGKPRQAHLGY